MSMMESPYAMPQSLTGTEDLAIGNIAIQQIQPLDVAGIDRRLTTIRTFDATSNVPDIPEEVALDLASSDLFADEVELAELLSGIEYDLDVFKRPATISPIILPDDDFTSQARRIFNDLSGADAAKVLNPNAVENFKAQAIRDGLLAPDTPIDSRWGGELNNAYFETMSQAFVNRLGGDKFGSISVGKVLDIMDDWTSPTGLLAAAVTANFIPDVDSTKNFLGGLASGVGNLLTGDLDGAADGFMKALTNIDDVAFPLMNTAMLFTGAGSIVAFSRFARAGFTYADDAIRAGSLAGRLLGVGGFADDAARLARPSFAAQKLLSRGGKLASVGDKMQAWRSYTGTIATKKAIQQGMRLGLTARTQSLIDGDLRGYGITGLGEQGERADGAKQGIYEQFGAVPVMAFEFSLAPSHLFTRGTGPLSAFSPLQSKAKNIFEIDRSQQMTMSMADAVMQTVALNPESVSTLSRIRDREGDVGLLTHVFGKGDKARADEVARYLAVTAGLDSMTDMALAAGVTSGLDEASLAGRRLRARVRGSYIAQLKHLPADLDLTTEEGALAFANMTAGLGRRDDAGRLILDSRKRIATDLMKEFRKSPEAFAAKYADQLAHHESVRLETLANVVNAATPERIAQVVQNAFDRIESWDDWNLGMQNLDEAFVFGVGKSRYPSWAADLDDPRIAGVQPAPWTEQSDYLNYMADGDPFAGSSWEYPAQSAVDTIAQPRVLDKATGEPVAPRYLYRVMSVEEWDEAQKLGRIQSARTADAANEVGTFAALDPQTAASYHDTPTGGVTKGDTVMVRFSYDDADGWQVKRTDNGGQLSFEAHTTAAIPLDKVDRVSPTIRATPGQFDDNLQVAGPTPVRGVKGPAAGSVLPVPKYTQAGVAQVGDIDTRLRETSLGWSGDTIRKSHWNNLIDSADMGLGYVTLARKSTPTLQEAAAYEGRVRQLIRARDELTGALEQGLDTYVVEGMEWAGDGTRELLDEVTKALDELNNQYDVWRRLEVIPERATTIDEKLKALAQGQEFRAAEVSVPPELAAKLGDYRVVRGVDFLRPSDMLGVDSPLADVTRKQRVLMSLGTWTGRVESGTVAGQRISNFKDSIGAALERYKAMGADLGPMGEAMLRSYREDPDLFDMDVQEVMRDLTRIFQEVQVSSEHAARVAETSSLMTKTFNRAMNSSLPQSRWQLKLSHLEGQLSGFNEAGVKAVVEAMRKANDVGFEYKGLAALEDKVIGNSWVRAAFKSFQPHSTMTASDGARSLARHITSEGQALSEYRTTLARIGDYWNRYGGTGGPGYRLAGAAVGAAIGSEEGADGALAGAVGGALGGRRVTSLRGIVRAWTGLQAAQMAEEQGQGVAGQVAAGLIGSTAAVKAGTFLSTGGLKALDSLNWADWSRVGDSALTVRNVVRFSLSPIFDLQRYTESMLLGSTAFDPDIPTTTNYYKSFEKWVSKADVADMVDPGGFSVAELAGVTPGPTTTPDLGWLKDMKPEQRKAALIDEFKDVSGRITGSPTKDLELVDDTQRWFTDRGLFGYSPTEQYAGAYGFLRYKKGLTREEAARKVWDTFTYGVAGRTPLEQSVNFVFFPFSFQKKYLGQVGRWMTDDLSRTVAIHNGLKMWNDLWERTNMSERYRAHFPILDSLRKLNSLLYGINPGEFGGINAPIFKALGNVPLLDMDERSRAIFNAFLPQALEVSDEGAAEDLKRTMLRFAPIYRDMEQFYEDTMSQMDVLSTGLSREAQEEQGWLRFNEEKARWNALAKQNGYRNISEARRTNEQINQLFNDSMREIEEEFPRWAERRMVTRQSAIQKDQELRQILQDAAAGAPDLVPGEVATAIFHQSFEELQASYGQEEIWRESPEDIPVEAWDWLHQVAVGLSARFDGFEIYYNNYFRSILGPIQQEIR